MSEESINQSGNTETPAAERIVIYLRPKYQLILLGSFTLVLILMATVQHIWSTSLPTAWSLWSTALILLAGFVFVIYCKLKKKNSILIIDEHGLSLRYFIKKRLIPWNCIKKVDLRRIHLDKWLIVTLADTPELGSFLDDKSIKRLRTDKNTGDRYIRVAITLCDLRGTDLVFEIGRRAKGKL